MARVRNPVEPPVVLTVAGSDSGGGAGIQADIKTIEACGGFATSAVTSVTAQHTRSVESTHVLPSGEVTSQCVAVRDDFAVGAVKTGMLATADIIECVTEQLHEVDAPVVVDPVMVAASGDRLLDPDAESAYESLIAESAVVTPNADEAEVLTDIAVTDTEGAVEAGHDLVEMGADAALLKGGHVSGEPVVDVLVTDGGVERISHPRVETAATHGSGCTLSAAIATHLARGRDRSTAVRESIDLLERAVRYGLDVGQGPGAVHHSVERRNEAAREPTAEAVTAAVGDLVEMDLARLVPEVGMNVVGATPYAESPRECAAVEGRLTPRLDGVKANGGVRFGASSHVARFLVAAREYEPEYRFAVNCRFGDAVESALGDLEWPVGSYNRSEQPEQVESVEGSTMQWGARQAFEGREPAPVAVYDPGAVGKEPMLKLLAADTDRLVERVQTLRGQLSA
ncbi:hydroxymethylpyrimidine/phosphomethylpyrimidine kinase [Halovenus aranensis]|uniref:Hydroxymethylpyrimidine/phosphomethylpyrimidine kinase n=1 Tax=Halovenus aranensis TaxID=890420 RepID=A0A1G8SP29_9EURY|nr:bifunctional hydroxymethylpyrimidine kinase/phosphomethylpyrimidine kinase [Halovenus aranensis]SDJ31016.1 hydroxymethylpyrimidine/phosphomethylpyrimidine kinase [Halovenus aranensis]